MILGIDLGTSSIKIVGLARGRVVRKFRHSYRENTPEGWIESLCIGLSAFAGEQITAIGLSSQVGTYIVNDSFVLSWQSGEGKEELETVRNNFSEEEFLREISMVHPQILSYPMPRILLLRKRFGEKIYRLCQPKDHLLRFLTGTFMSDPYSWRGLADQTTGRYSRRFLDWLGLDEEVLPELIRPHLAAGTLTEAAARRCGLRSGIPVYTGCNDFYASLIGMGVTDTGSCFDVTGTSEHLGLITEQLQRVPALVSSPYLHANVCYGVTASSGVSLNFGLRELDLEYVSCEVYRNRRDLPIFLPYLNGERAPIYNAHAKGVFFGLNERTTREEMAYSIMEGVTFSIYHIYSEMEVDRRPERMVLSGGSAANAGLNQMKADLFGIPTVVCRESDTSALGAAIWAAVGERQYSTLQEAAGAVCMYENAFQPRDSRILQDRFEVYRSIYQSLIPDFERYESMLRR